MPRGVKKENLPSKLCVICNRPFTWRKKWERCWEEVTTCSKSCNSERRSKASQISKNTKGVQGNENDIEFDEEISPLKDIWTPSLAFGGNISAQLLNQKVVLDLDKDNKNDDKGLDLFVDDSKSDSNSEGENSS